MLFGRFVLPTLCVVLVACTPAAPEKQSDTSEPVTEPVTQAFIWTDAFQVMGDGYPAAGDPCRRLGESALTVNYLDDSAILVGCPGAATDAAAAAIAASGGKVVGAAEGVTMISIPQGNANAGMAAAVGSQAMADDVLPAETSKK